MERQQGINSCDHRAFVWAVWLDNNSDGENLGRIGDLNKAKLIGKGKYSVSAGELGPSDDFVIEDVSKIERIMHSLSAAEDKEKAGFDEVDDFIKRVNHFVFENLSSPDILKETAKTVAFSEGYFSHLFKTVTGTSFMAFVKKQRLERARLYLRMSKSSVAEIGERIGYGNPAYFSSVYKDYFKISPQEERRRMNEALKKPDLKMNGDLL